MSGLWSPLRPYRLRSTQSLYTVDTRFFPSDFPVVSLPWFPRYRRPLASVFRLLVPPLTFLSSRSHLSQPNLVHNGHRVRPPGRPAPPSHLDDLNFPVLSVVTRPLTRTQNRTLGEYYRVRLRFFQIRTKRDLDLDPFVWFRFTLPVRHNLYSCSALPTNPPPCSDPRPGTRGTPNVRVRTSSLTYHDPLCLRLLSVRVYTRLRDPSKPDEQSFKLVSDLPDSPSPVAGVRVVSLSDSCVRRHSLVRNFTKYRDIPWCRPSHLHKRLGPKCSTKILRRSVFYFAGSVIE